jgi:hypothetical protein
MLFKNLKLQYFRGNYDLYESTAREMMLVQQRQHEAQMVKVQHMQVRWKETFSGATALLFSFTHSHATVPGRRNTILILLGTLLVLLLLFLVWYIPGIC